MLSEINRPSPQEIDAAGRTLVELRHVREREGEWLDAVRVVDSWRRLHSEPLRTFQANLRRRVGRDGVVATRLKRLPSIIGKLERLSRIRLSRMQDIGGCRVIARTADEAFQIAGNLADSRLRHELARRWNYIDEPRPTGYRGIHLIYSYTSDRRTHLNGLNIEIQLRSQRQHQWATAVETVGAFIGQELKAGRGDAEWLRFFALMSSAIAHVERKPGIPQTPQNPRVLGDELRASAERLRVDQRIAAFQQAPSAMPRFSKGKGHWHVIELDMGDQVMRGTSYSQSQYETAFAFYSQVELLYRERPEVDVVLVSADSLTGLRRAFPNYFADLTAFRQLLQETLAGL